MKIHRYGWMIDAVKGRVCMHCGRLEEECPEPGCLDEEVTIEGIPHYLDKYTTGRQRRVLHSLPSGDVRARKL